MLITVIAHFHVIASNTGLNVTHAMTKSQTPKLNNELKLHGLSENVCWNIQMHCYDSYERNVDITYSLNGTQGRKSEEIFSN